jgi:putative drug exporter of the RND superfamily
VFILARMREAIDGGRSTDEAVIEGLGRTGRLVTCGALMLFLRAPRWPGRGSTSRC